jgi:kynurenine formamidase
MMPKRARISITEFDQLFESLKNWGRWGSSDEKGTLNYLTPEKVRAAASLVKTGRSVSMAIPINTVAGPDNPNPAIHYMNTTHDIQFHGDCHTHIDALCHIAYRGKLYNDRPASLVTARGARGLDITTYAPGIVGRGVLIDAARHRDVRWLEPSEAVTAEEIEAIEKAEGVRLEEGDIMVFRTGHHRWVPGMPATRAKGEQG